MALQTFNPLSLIKPRDADLQSAMGKEFENSINAVKSRYAEPMEQSKIAEQFANAQKLSRPEVGEFQKAIADAMAVKAQYGENSPEAQLASAWLQRKAEGAPGMQLDIDPSTGAISFRQGNAPGGSGKGSQVVDGKYITPPSSAVVNEQQGKQLSNVVRDFLSKAADQPYIGEGSNVNLLDDWSAYKQTRDPAIAEKLIQAAVTYKLLPEIALQQLQSQGVKATVSAQKHQRDAIMLGWPASLKYVVDNLPPDLQKQAKQRHDELLKESHRLQTQHYAQGTPFELENAPQNLKNEDLSSWSTQQILEALNNAK